MHIRYLIRRDIPRVLEIEQDSYEFPLNEKQIIDLIRNPTTIGLVHETDAGQVVAHTIYTLHSKYMDVLTLAVHPGYRMCGVGRDVFDHLASKLTRGRRERIKFLISEANLGGLNFLKKLGLRATKVVKRPWEETHLDGIQMEFRVYEDRYCRGS